MTKYVWFSISNGMTSSIQKIIIGLTSLLVIGFFGYNLFGPDSKVETLVETSSTPESVGGETLKLIDKLKTISINQNIFSEALFTNLKDFTQTVSPELQKRANPFATIGSDIFAGSSNFSQSPTNKTQ